MTMAYVYSYEDPGDRSVFSNASKAATHAAARNKLSRQEARHIAECLRKGSEEYKFKTVWFSVYRVLVK